ncbi:MAG: hypothetical protein A2Z18_04715 [Armatimonadetes bacterium RBG_16_58_9]|nr:MAG: hypothetical protein A2Z18_04715 [Armatimonadetes bacterium RBG_16_58_9]
MAEATQQITTAGIVGPYAMSTGSLGGGPFGLQEAVSEYNTVRENGAWVRLLLPATGLNTSDFSSGWRAV